jgi:LysR family glycine cleavage system transcriptional activator
MMSLQAFEASARYLSFAEAAREMSLTQGAISRQVRILEDMLGCELFERARSGLLLTVAGEEFLLGLRPGLERLETTATRVSSRRDASRRLHLATLPGFGSRWLVPRLATFIDAYPEIDIAFFTATEPIDFEKNPLHDAAIHFGRGPQAGAQGDWLMDEEPIPVCHPNLRHPEGLSSVEAISRYRLLQPLRRASGWADWLAAAGMAGARTRQGLAFEQLHLLIEAACAGLGLALLPRFMVEAEIADGTLVCPFDQRVNSGWYYWLVYPNKRKPGDALKLFRRWLVEEGRIGKHEDGIRSNADHRRSNENQ